MSYFNVSLSNVSFFFNRKNFSEDFPQNEMKKKTYSPEVVLFESCRRITRGDCGAVGGALTSNLRLNIGEAAIALFCRVNCWTFCGPLNLCTMEKNV